MTELEKQEILKGIELRKLEAEKRNKEYEEYLNLEKGVKTLLITIFAMQIINAIYICTK